MPSLEAELQRLSSGAYVSLTTFRRSGVPVPTPVWVNRDGDHLYVITDANSGKAKRLRNNPEVRLAPCDARGTVSGPPVSGTARLLDAAGTAHVRRLTNRRHRLLGPVFAVLGKVRGGGESIGIEITVRQD